MRSDRILRDVAQSLLAAENSCLMALCLVLLGLRKCLFLVASQREELVPPIGGAKFMLRPISDDTVQCDFAA